MEFCPTQTFWNPMAYLETPMSMLQMKWLWFRAWVGKLFWWKATISAGIPHKAAAYSDGVVRLQFVSNFQWPQWFVPNGIVPGGFDWEFGVRGLGVSARDEFFRTIKRNIDWNLRATHTPLTGDIASLQTYIQPDNMTIFKPTLFIPA